MADVLLVVPRAHARVRGLELPDDLPAAVVGAVVEHDDVDLDTLLLEDALYALA